MSKTKCSICGKDMDERRDEKGKPYKVQLCSNTECQWTAWREVTGALKHGRCPVFAKKEKGKRVYKKTTPEEKQNIINLHMQGLRQCDIARELDMAPKTVSNVIAAYRRKNREE